MARYRAEIERDFLDSYSVDFLGNLLRALNSNYGASYRESNANYPTRIAHDLYPQMRRAMLDRALLALVNDYPGVTASMEPNHAGTGFYLLLSSGNVFLTANAADHPNRLPRYAKFRETYAQASTPNLFDEPPDEGEILYAMLLHGPEAMNKMRPDFAHIVFPNKDCSKILGRINLFTEVARLDGEARGVEEETFEDKAFPALKPDAGRRKSEEEAG